VHRDRPGLPPGERCRRVVEASKLDHAVGGDDVVGADGESLAAGASRTSRSRPRRAGGKRGDQLPPLTPPRSLIVPVGQRGACPASDRCAVGSRPHRPTTAVGVAHDGDVVLSLFTDWVKAGDVEPVKFGVARVRVGGDDRVGSRRHGAARLGATAPARSHPTREHHSVQSWSPVAEGHGAGGREPRRAVATVAV